MKELEFKQYILHYYRNSFEKIGVQRRFLKDTNKSEIYLEEEWIKLSKETGIEKNKLRRWRSEYDKFFNAFETLNELAKVGKFNNLNDFINSFFGIKTNEISSELTCEKKTWSSKAKENMIKLNDEDFENRIKLCSIISFICNMKKKEDLEEILNLFILIINKYNQNDIKEKNKIISIIKLLKISID
ncbi:hypothetical protein GCL60_08630 [Silvanigrella paludirubra]|uniref:Uncharacterized protein n=1 Tax=Silvanigrella paludirubra TaxID=2499159 RepID=A0A6N6VWS3_9BACT|nr:hypothetical protein [Silvanigrella paludirubra]KAB8038913.1 hypothetical protein GCL60_08630 [Silvanigrella paludirubra]